jgi:hypothetical protein
MNVDPLKFLNSIRNVVEGVVVCTSEEVVDNADISLLREEYGEVFSGDVAWAVKEFCNSWFTTFVKYVLLYDPRKAQFILVVGRDFKEKHVVQVITLDPSDFVEFVKSYSDDWWREKRVEDEEGVVF